MFQRYYGGYDLSTSNSTSCSREVSNLRGLLRGFYAFLYSASRYSRLFRYGKIFEGAPCDRGQAVWYGQVGCDVCPKAVFRSYVRSQRKFVSRAVAFSGGLLSRVLRFLDEDGAFVPFRGLTDPFCGGNVQPICRSLDRYLVVRRFLGRVRFASEVGRFLAGLCLFFRHGASVFCLIRGRLVGCVGSFFVQWFSKRVRFFRRRLPRLSGCVFIRPFSLCDVFPRLFWFSFF